MKMYWPDLWAQGWEPYRIIKHTYADGTWDRSMLYHRVDGKGGTRIRKVTYRKTQGYYDDVFCDTK